MFPASGPCDFAQMFGGLREENEPEDRTNCSILGRASFSVVLESVLWEKDLHIEQRFSSAEVSGLR